MNTDVNTLIQRIQSDNELQAKGCEHFKDIQEVTPSFTNGCEDCKKMGDGWTRLRICLACGYVGCCDTSKNQHARKHYNATKHPMILSFEPRELWMYCFDDDEIFIAPE
jgi:uncharacterized UBP type Zn finger protein